MVISTIENNHIKIFISNDDIINMFNIILASSNCNIAYSNNLNDNYCLNILNNQDDVSIYLNCTDDYIKIISIPSNVLKQNSFDYFKEQLIKGFNDNYKVIENNKIKIYIDTYNVNKCIDMQHNNNFIKQFVDSLKLKINEKFDIVCDRQLLYKDCYFTNEHFICGSPATINIYYILGAIASNYWQVKRHEHQQFKPHNNEQYFIPSISNGAPRYASHINYIDDEYGTDGTFKDRYNESLVFRTKEEALQMVIEILNYIKTKKIGDENNAIC